MTRISYTQQKDGRLKSSTVRTKKGVEYFATICYNLGEWRIYNAKRRNVVKQGKATNKNVLRRVVRRNLIILGVEFEKEFGKKGYAVSKR